MSTQNDTAAAPATLPPDSIILQTALGGLVTQAVYVAAKLGIADLIDDVPQTAEALAEKTGTHVRSLYRVLRTLASVGIFSEVAGKAFQNTPASSTLRADAPNSTRDSVIWMGEEPHWQVHGHLLESVRTGKTVWETVHNEACFPYMFQTNKDLGEIFNRAMTSFSHMTVPAVIDAYKFAGHETVADIAGGFGHLLAGVIKNYPDMKGILFDVGVVLEGAPQMLASHGVAERVELVEGDFFAAIPVKADVYVMKHIIHDWDDDQCETILRNIRNVMADDAKILIVESVIGEDNAPSPGKILDLEMMMIPGGIERTAAEFRQLLRRSGFELTRIIETRSPLSIVEAVKA